MSVTPAACPECGLGGRLLFGEQRGVDPVGQPSAQQPWRLGSTNRGTASHWQRLQIGPSRCADGRITARAYSVDVPVALRLDFAAGEVWFVAGIPRLPDPRRVFIPGDEIMVVFSVEKMRDMGFDDPLSPSVPVTGPAKFGASRGWS